MVAEAVGLTAGDDSIEIEDGLRNKWMGASGFKHQIDVSVEHTDRILLIEAKC